MSFTFNSTYQQELKNDLVCEWLPNGPVVSVLQGFPGTGKSTIAMSVLELTSLEPIFLEMNSTSGDLFLDFYMDLAANLETSDINLLSTEIEKGANARILDSIVHLINRNPLFILIDDFQWALDKKSELPSKQFQDLILKLNKLPNAAGKLMIISNRQIKKKRWNESSFVVSIYGFKKEESKDFLEVCLLKNNLSNKVPKSRIQEIAVRLGGNPRAILTFVASLFYDSLDEILSLKPSLFEIGDVSISQNLILEFEEELIQRSISSLDSDSRMLLQFISVYRRPFNKKPLLNIPLSEVDELRYGLIGRYFIQNTNRGDVLHPVVKEVFISQLMQNPENWVKAHGNAADFYLDSFKVSDKSKYSTMSISYSELRHHLVQSNRAVEISAVSKKLTRYLLSRITTPQQSQIPSNREQLEERIALISVIPDSDRPKGLEYHLALCLKERNKDGDFEKALKHSRRSASPYIYYAAWLLRLDLEASVEGMSSMLKAFEESLRYVKNDNNVFAIYRRCAELFHQDGNINKSIEILKLGIKNSGIQCYTSIAPLCADYMAESGKTNDAISLLLTGIETPGVKRLVTLYQKCASLMVQEKKYDDARKLLEKALAKPDISKLYAIRLQLADILDESDDREGAIKVLADGIENCGDEDPTSLLIRCSELLASEGRSEEAVKLLKVGMDSKKIRKPEKVLYVLADKLFEDGNSSDGVDLLMSALTENFISDRKRIYIKCADIFFREENLIRSESILKKALNEHQINDKWEIYKKCADIIYRQDRVDEAIDLIKEGVDDPKCSSTYVLYQTGSKILTKEGKLDDAIEFLKEGVKASSTKDKAALYLELSKLLKRKGDSDSAIILLKEAINTPGIKGVPRLYKACSELYKENNHPEEAISMIEYAIQNIKYGNIAPLYKIAAEILIDENNVGQAHFFLSKGLERYPKDDGLKWALQKFKTNQYVCSFSSGIPSELSSEDTRQETIRKIEYFKHKIEKEDCYRIFFSKDGSLAAQESDVQYLFKLVWENSESSVDSEVKNGLGIVDFKIARGRKDTTLVEFKLGSNSSLERNVENQTEIYAAVNQTEKHFTVIVIFSEADQIRVNKILEKLGKLDDEKIYIIDGRRDNKHSASVAKSH